MKKRRKLLSCIFVFVIIFVIILYFRPVKISKVIHSESNSALQVIYMSGNHDLSNPDYITKNYKFDSSSNECKTIYSLFEKYYYHSSFNTLMNDTQFNKFDVIIVIKNNKHSITLIDNSIIMIDNKPYKMGCIGNQKSRSLISELLSILKIES